MRLHSLLFYAACAALQLSSTQVYAFGNTAKQALAQAASASAIERVAATGTLEVAFSPNQGAEALVLKVINASRSDIKLMAYSFTSATVTRALVAAVKRGVRVQVLADEKHNLGPGAGDKARAALSALATVGAQVRVISTYPIFHQKVIVSDGQHTQTGSFNYSSSAASRNSENVMVNWHNPDLAMVYANNFALNWAISQQFKIGY